MSVTLQIMDNTKQVIDLIGRECRCRLIHNQNLRVQRECLCDFDNLLLGYCQFPDNRVGINIKMQLLQIFSAVFPHAAAVNLNAFHRLPP